MDVLDQAPRPNVVVLFPDQLRASSLPIYGEHHIETPNIDRLASEGVRLTNAISNCPVCTPARAMLVTGRHPQTTGHLINTTRTRHSEISIADTFARQGYRTGWVGKWHLHTGLWPAIDRMPQQPDWVPEGRDRLGFDYWRAYNQHMVYFDGFVQVGDWNYERWDGYETDGLLRYAFEFMDGAADDGAELDGGGGGADDPFLLFLAPHPPHYTPFEFAPADCYEGLPEVFDLPATIDGRWYEESQEMYRHYMAMIRAIDQMVGRVMRFLDDRGLAENTIVVFASDHGTQGGDQGVHPWQKKHPYESSIRIPGIFRYPGVLEAGTVSDGLFAMPDFFPTLCGLAGITVPRSVEGMDLSTELRDQSAAEQEAVLLMNFSNYYDWFEDGAEWRGVRTTDTTYCRWLDGRTELFDLVNDPLQHTNLAADPGYRTQVADSEEMLRALQAVRGDELVACSDWKHWLDEQRRVVRNAYGPLSHPESIPDWSLLS
ncbi:MAG: sulfatase [Actinomycetia bacterium]|nr:sulfatase [Actinomycetes bacterium]